MTASIDGPGRTSVQAERHQRTGGFLVTADVHVSDPASLTASGIEEYVTEVANFTRNRLKDLAKGHLT